MNIESLKAKKESLYSEICRIRKEINQIDEQIKEEFQKLPFVEALAEYIKYQEYPTDLFNSFGMDSGEYDSFGKVQLKVVYNYGYTDVIGLTDEEFRQLKKLLYDSLEDDEDDDEEFD